MGDQLVTVAAAAVGLVAVYSLLVQRFDKPVPLITTLLLLTGTSLWWAVVHESRPIETGGFAVCAVVSLWITAGRSRRTAWVAAAVAVVATLALRRLDADAPMAREGAVMVAGDVGSALFSSTHGFLSLTPLAYAALVGALADLRTRRPARGAALAACALIALGGLWIPPAPLDGRFGNGLTPALALLAPGLAWAIDRARAKPWIAISMLIAGAVSWNDGLMVQYTSGMLPKDEPVSFATMVRQQADVHTRATYLYPFAAPANLWFAWREGVPTDRYELLANRPLASAFDLAFDRTADAFLLDGWEAVGAQRGEPVRWTREARATLVFPFAPSAAADISIIVTARARLDDPPRTASVGLEVNGRELARAEIPPDAPIDVAVRVPAFAGNSPLRTGYNRLTVVSHAAALVDPADVSPAGPLARRLVGRPWPIGIYRVRIVSAR
jgi:hypothetical protein